MKVVPKWFYKWFRRYGQREDVFWLYTNTLKALNISWRAYQKGRKDMKKQMESKGDVYYE